MKTLGVIMGRSGSLGLKDKHLRPLLGQPVISYTFEHARSAQLLNRTVLSSDCPKILSLARRAGIETIERPPELATSDASVQSVLLHAMHEVERRDGWYADAIACLYGNVAVRPPEVIDRAIEMLRDTGCDSVRNFSPVGKWHPYWMARIPEDKVLLLHPNNVHRRQDLEEVFIHDGAIFVVSRSSLLRGEANPNDPHALFGTDRRAVKTGFGQAIEIDHIRDLYWAEAALRDQRETMRAAS